MRTGVGLSLGQPVVPVRDMLSLAGAADRAGACLVGVGDSFAEAFGILGALAVATESVELMTGIATWTRTPITTALATSTLQYVSGGRAALGLGAMPRSWSEDWHSVDYTKPVDRMRDFVGAVRAAYEAGADHPASYQGSHYAFRNYERLAAAAEHPLQVVLASTGPRMTALAGEIADAVLMNTVCSPEWYAAKSLPALAEGAERTGRSLDAVGRGAMVYCSIDEDEGVALDRARPGLAFYYRTPYFLEILRWHGFERELEVGLAAWEAGDRAAASASVTDDMVRTFCLVGTRGQVLEQVVPYAARYDWVQLACPVGNDRDVVIGLLEQTIEVIPEMSALFEADRPRP